jgi:hypothetical protein
VASLSPSSSQQTLSTQKLHELFPSHAAAGSSPPPSSLNLLWPLGCRDPPANPRNLETGRSSKGQSQPKMIVPNAADRCGARTLAVNRHPAGYSDLRLPCRSAVVVRCLRLARLRAEWSSRGGAGPETRTGPCASGT